MHSRRATRRERWFQESPEPVREGETYYVMDLSKQELDCILQELNSHGFFSERGKPSDSESQLEVRLNRSWTVKCWSYEPILDDLTTRVYEEGEVRTVNQSAPREEDDSSKPFSLHWPFGQSR